MALAVFGATLIAPPRARAQVTLEQSQIVVNGEGARAVIERNPFRLSIETADGTPVLSEVSSGGGIADSGIADSGSTPRVLAPTVDPQPPGVDASSSGELYAPLSFLVGQETLVQYDGLVWGGNLASGERSGVEFSAQAVTAATPSGEGVVLTVSTDDPTGRTLSVSVQPAGAGLIGVSVTPVPATGVAMMTDAFASSSSEAFYGFGGRHDALNQHGRALSSWVSEENLDSPLGDTPTAPLSGLPAGELTLWPNGPTAAYDPQAEFISSRGYGFLVGQSELTRFRLDSDRPDAWSVAVSAPELHYLVAPGGMTRAVTALSSVGGREPAPPEWALGPMMDRLVKNFGETEANYSAELHEDIANIDLYHLPLTAYRIEGWGLPGNGSNDGLFLITSVNQSTQAEIISELRERGIHPLVYLRPWITPGSAPDVEGLTVKGANGETEYTTSTTGTKIALLDFTNPAAVRYWDKEIDKALDLGADGFMADFGEEVLADMHFANGTTGTTMHNAYPVLYDQVTRAAISAYEQAHPGRTLWFFTRAGYSGAPGSAAYVGGDFPGDETTDWSHSSGLASLTSDMLNRAVGGAYGYGTDIGGYFDYTTPPTTKELFLRWAEWAALSPVFRLHGSGFSGTHTPWSYDEETVSIYRSLSLLHEAAAPLILRLWHEADGTGVPPTRPLWLQYPGDATAAAQDQEWMLGPDVLVAPVVTEGATSRTVYFPKGCWRDPQTGREYEGPISESVAAPLAKLPYYFHCNTEPFSP